MIQANELRIGNWVHRVLISNGNHVQYEQVNLIPMYELQSSKVIPMPLTEEILFKCGFVNSGMFFVKDQVYIYTSNIIEFEFIYKYNYTYVGLEYLHQLQNLIYILSGKELNVNI